MFNIILEFGALVRWNGHAKFCLPNQIILGFLKCDYLVDLLWIRLYYEIVP